MIGIDTLQKEASQKICQTLRLELGKDIYMGRISCIVLTANSITDVVNIDTCNLGTALTNSKAQAIILSALGQLKRKQMGTAILSMLLPVLKQKEESYAKGVKLVNDSFVKLDKLLIRATGKKPKGAGVSKSNRTVGSKGNGSSKRPTRHSRSKA